MSVKFEGYERRIAKIEKALKEYGIESLEAARDLCLSKGVDVDKIVRDVQQIAFENAVWAYTLGAAIAIKKGSKSAAEAAENIGLGLQAFCIPGSVADSRQVGIGHGNLAAMLLREETKCFCFLAGHESFAAAEGAIGIAKTANKVRKEPLRVILNGLGKDAGYIISRINGFTHVETEYDYYTGELKIVEEKAFSKGPKAAVKCYGADDVSEGVAIMVPGLQLESAWRVIDDLDNQLATRLSYAFDDRLGYLTCCPTNVGTGMRASVMLHLPGLVLTGQIAPTIQGINKLNLAVRGIGGEGTDNRGNLFQVSNQSTLGESEAQILERLNTVIGQLVAHEKSARQLLLQRDQFSLLDHVGRSYGTLRHSYKLSSEEAINCLSGVRVGVDLGMFSALDIHTVNELFIGTGAAHLQKSAGRILNAVERDVSRAALCREKLKL